MTTGGYQPSPREDLDGRLIAGHLTGRTRYRQSWRGKIIVQVEILKREGVGLAPDEGIGVDWVDRIYWQDATLRDLENIRNERRRRANPTPPPPAPRR